MLGMVSRPRCLHVPFVARRSVYGKAGAIVQILTPLQLVSVIALALRALLPRNVRRKDAIYFEKGFLFCL
jgi:hypothetical protein